MWRCAILISVYVSPFFFMLFSCMLCCEIHKVQMTNLLLVHTCDCILSTYMFYYFCSVPIHTMLEIDVVRWKIWLEHACDFTLFSEHVCSTIHTCTKLEINVMRWQIFTGAQMWFHLDFVCKSCAMACLCDAGVQGCPHRRSYLLGILNTHPFHLLFFK